LTVDTGRHEGKEPVAVEVVTRTSQLQALVPEWEGLLRASETNEPMLSPSWLLPWWAVFGPVGGRTLRTLAVRKEGRLVGLVPLLRRVHWYRPGIPFRRLEMLGTGEAEADEVCSEYLGPLCARGYEDQVLAALVMALRAGQLGGWDEVLFPAMDGAGGLPGRLVATLRRGGLSASDEVTGQAPHVPLPSSWEEYLAALPSKHRYVVRRALRDFDAWAEGPATFRVAATEDELGEGRRILLELHGERWNESRGGAFGSERFDDFHRRVMPALLEKGALELAWLEVAGAPAAIAYNIVWDDKVYFYQSGRRVDLPGHVRPGIVLHARAIQHAIEGGRREYDFLNGATRYKRQLSLASRSLVRVRVQRAPVRDRLHAMVEGGVSSLRVRLRRGIPRRVEGAREPPKS
jgi:CelD/BcsL family acetyltransferase involved in cellulose biosynthesis